MPCCLAANSASFGPLDWGIVAAYLLLTTLIGARLSGKQATIRDFFLGGRKIPWWAVCGSIVASEISAATFLAVPAITFAAGGDMTYLQLGIGAILARVMIGICFVPRFYEREIYSPYDYMGNRLGPRVRVAATLLFFVGGCLGQGARVLVTAFLLREVAGIDLITAIWALGLFGIGWTLIGGITTVIWTDVAQFVILFVGAVAALAFAVHSVDGGTAEVLRIAREVDKLRVLDLRGDPSVNFTLWMGLFSMPFLNLAALGLDQAMAQRIFCCRTQRQASLAIIVSSVGQLIAVLMLFVGIAVYAYYRHHPPEAEAAARMAADATVAFPYYIVHEVSAGLRGLIVAAIFAASMTSGALAALSQTTIATFREPLLRALGRSRGPALSDVALSRLLVVFWGLVLSIMATACIPIRAEHEHVIDLVLNLVAYTYGPMLGIFLLAFLPLNRDDAGVLWAVPTAMLAVFALSVRGDTIDLAWIDRSVPWSSLVVWAGGAVLACFAAMRLDGDARRIGAMMLALTAILLLERTGQKQGFDITLSPYWSYPLGTCITLFVAWALGRPRATA